MDKKVKRITVFLIILMACCFTFFYLKSSSSYLPAWLSFLFAALFVLLTLSIPRYLSITKSSLEIHCILEVTVIPLENIKSIAPINNRDMKWCLPVPIIGVWGIFGYYGYYFDLKNLKLFKLYASHWGDFVRIENIYEEVIIVSLPDYENIIRDIS